MFRKSIYLGFLVVLSLAVIIPGNSVLAKSNLSSDTVVTKNNVHQVLEYLNIDTTNYSNTEIEENVESTPKVTVGELKESVDKMKQMPKEITIKNSSQNSDDSSNTDDFSTLSSTSTVSYTTNLNSYSVTFQQTGRYEANRRYEAWTAALGSNASVTSTVVDRVDHKKTAEKYNAYVKNPGSRNSVLHMTADITVSSYVFGVKTGSQDIHNESRWDSSDIY